jgi:UDP-N-acetylmuramoyl-L-alanyl-D-glutamate--2,6-diaminopimelate ligase
MSVRTPPSTLPARCALARLLAGYGAAVPDLEVSGVEMDSRRVTPGDLFLACRGSGTRHGLDYLEQALENGAAAVAWEPAPGIAAPLAQVPLIAVERLSRRVGEIAGRFYGEPGQQLFTAGVTGTDGKTSTAYLIAQMFDQLDTPCAYVGTLGSGRVQRLAAGTHTTPDAVSLQRRLAHLREQGVAAAALEVSSHALDQDRVSGLAFDVAILTNLTRDHLDYHGTLDHYAAAKKRLFTHYRRGEAVFNRDDATGRQWADELLTAGDAAVTVFGIEGETPRQGHHVIARDLHLHDAGQRFTAETSWGEATIESRLLGRFNCYNLCSALAAALCRGTPIEQAAAALAQAQTVPGRIEGFRGPSARPLVVVDYAHTPDALGQILQAVRAHTRKRLWCVFGCGGDRDRGKRPLMAAAAARHADQVIITDDNPRSESPQAIVADICAGLPEGYRAREIHDRAEAIAVAVHGAEEGDVVVVAGKGHETTQTYGTEARPFSDREVVARLVGVPPP